MAPLCYLRHRFPPEIIQHAIWLYLRFTLSYSDADEGVRLLELARNARRPFESQEPREKRRLLNFLVSNCSWRSGELTATHADPLIFRPKRRLRFEKGKAADGVANGPSQIWLPGPDSNQRPSG